MCGIFLHFTKNGIIKKEMMKKLLCFYSFIEHRGPDRHTLSLYNNCLIGFHRLAINDLSEKGDQPFELNDEWLVCNGEIYNYEELQNKYKFPLRSKSDCEILLHLFQKFGLSNALEMIDGVFAIVYGNSSKIYIIRDRIGVKPLFYSTSFDTNSITIASEPIALDGLNQNIVEVLPSTFIIYDKSNYIETVNYYSLPSFPIYTEEEMVLPLIKNKLINAVRKRLSSNRPIGCLLSGGLDSSLIASILSKENIPFKTFSVGFPDSTDLIYARKVADYLKTDHYELVITYESAIKYIPTVIRKLGSYDTTTIRASTPMYMLCEWINTNFKERVIFSGEGSDELFCGYLYSHNAPSEDELYFDSIRLVKQLYKYDVLRAERCTSGNSLELREPFLDKELIELALQLSGNLKKPKEFEKDILRKAFTGYLPDDVLWRRKAAFSDAVSSSEKPWYKWIQESLENANFEIQNFEGTKESNYYKTLFINFYSSYKPLIPLWLPKWSDTGQEPSATVLNVYKKDEHV